MPEVFISEGYLLFLSLLLVIHSKIHILLGMWVLSVSFSVVLEGHYLCMLCDGHIVCVISACSIHFSVMWLSWAVGIHVHFLEEVRLSLDLVVVGVIIFWFHSWVQCMAAWLNSCRSSSVAVQLETSLHLKSFCDKVGRGCQMWIRLNRSLHLCVAVLPAFVRARFKTTHYLLDSFSAFWDLLGCSWSVLFV